MTTKKTHKRIPYIDKIVIYICEEIILILEKIRSNRIQKSLNKGIK